MAPLGRWVELIVTLVRVSSQHAEVRSISLLLASVIALVMASRRGWFADVPWPAVAVIVAGLAFLFRRVAAGGKCEYAADLAGDVVIITGGNTGIGKQAALRLVRQGATVVLACRNPKLALPAAASIRKQAGLASDSDRVRYAGVGLSACAAVVPPPVCVTQVVRGHACAQVHQP